MNKRQHIKTARSRMEQEQERVNHLIKVGFILGMSVGLFSCGGLVYVALRLMGQL